MKRAFQLGDYLDLGSWERLDGRDGALSWTARYSFSCSFSYLGPSTLLHPCSS